MSATISEPILTYFYRYKERIDHNGNVKLDLIRFVGFKKTPKGTWIMEEKDYENYQRAIELYGEEGIPDWEWKRHYKKRWIRDEIYRKSYAYPTKMGAMKNFMKRKEIHIKILETQHKNAVEAFKLGAIARDELIGHMSREFLEGVASV